MNPLGTVALGLLVVLLDFRIAGFDVLADVVGWVVAVVGLSRLTSIDRRFRAARGVAVVSAVLSLADLVHPQRTTTTGDGPGSMSTSTTATVTPDGLQGLLAGAHGVAMVVTVLLLSLALRDRARQYDEPVLAARFGMFAVVHLMFGVLMLALAVAALLTGTDRSITPQGTAAALTLLFVVAALAFEAWFLVTLAGARTRPWLQPVGSAAPPA